MTAIAPTRPKSFAYDAYQYIVTTGVAPAVSPDDLLNIIDAIERRLEPVGSVTYERHERLVNDAHENGYAEGYAASQRAKAAWHLATLPKVEPVRPITCKTCTTKPKRRTLRDFVWGICRG